MPTTSVKYNCLCMQATVVLVTEGMQSYRGQNLNHANIVIVRVQVTELVYSTIKIVA